MDGKSIRSFSFETSENEFQYFSLDNLGVLPAGQYILHYNDGLNIGNILITK